MKRSRAALTFFLTTFGLSLIAIGSTCNRSGAADVTATPPGVSSAPASSAEACSNGCYYSECDVGYCGDWNAAWRPLGDHAYDSLERNARAAISGLVQLINESVAAQAAEFSRDVVVSAEQGSYLEVYGCEGYDSDHGWYDEKEAVAQTADDNSVECFHNLAAWRDLSALAADTRCVEGQAAADEINAANDGLADELYPDCGRSWHTSATAATAAADAISNSRDPEAAFVSEDECHPGERAPVVAAPVAIGLDCDEWYYGIDESISETANAGSVKPELDWVFDESPTAAVPAAESTVETNVDPRPAILAAARMLEQVGAMLSGWGRDLHRSVAQSEAELTSAADRETWGL